MYLLSVSFFLLQVLEMGTIASHSDSIDLPYDCGSSV